MAEIIHFARAPAQSDRTRLRTAAQAKFGVLLG